jgi:hypothetical protein
MPFRIIGYTNLFIFFKCNRIEALVNIYVVKLLYNPLQWWSLPRRALVTSQFRAMTVAMDMINMSYVTGAELSFKHD